MGATAKAWFLAQELHLQVRLTQQVVEVLTELTALVRRNFEVGSVSREDVVLVEADLAAAQAAVRQARAAQTQVVRALELLLGRYPAASLERRGAWWPSRRRCRRACRRSFSNDGPT